MSSGESAYCAKPRKTSSKLRTNKRLSLTENTHPEVFRVGAIVLKKDLTRKKRKGGKLDCKWVGLYEIVCTLGHGLYWLRDTQCPNKVLSRVNGVHLKKYILPSNVSFIINQRV